VSGTIKLTAPAVTATDDVSYKVDDKAVETDQLDTTDLDNGTHTITATATDDSGKTTEVKQKVTVTNKATFFQSLVAGAKTNAPYAGLAVLILVIAIAVWVVSRKVLAKAALSSPSGVHTNLNDAGSFPTTNLDDTDQR
jgi:hypothetical protein